MNSRRKMPRSAYLAKVVVLYQDEGGAEVAMPGMIEDRSQTGLGIRVKGPIPVGCAVRVQQNSKTHSGVVRRCSKSGKALWGFIGEYFLGIEFRSLPA